MTQQGQEELKKTNGTKTQEDKTAENDKLQKNTTIDSDKNNNGKISPETEGSDLDKRVNGSGIQQKGDISGETIESKTEFEKIEIKSVDYIEKYEKLTAEPQSTAEKPHKSLYVFCERCNKHIYLYYPEEIVTKATSYPVNFVWIHGNPLHGLLVRLDKNFVSRGERVVELGFNMDDLKPNE